MNIILLFRWYGENPKEVVEQMHKIAGCLEKKGYKVYHATKYADYFEEKKLPQWKRLEFTFKEIDDSKFMLVYQKSEEISQGMLIEIGYGIAKGKKIIWAKKKGVENRYLTDGASKIIEFEDFNDLIN